MPGSSSAEALLTIKEAAELLQVSQQTLRRWDRSGRLAATRHAARGYRLYDREAVLACAVALHASHASQGAAAAELEGSGPGRRGGPSLPPPGSAFVGRGEELAAVTRAFGDGDRLVTIVGPPGIGKTRLARRHLEVEHEPQCGRCATGFCDLGRATGAGEVCAALADALTLAPLGGARSVSEEAVGEELERRGPLLLVLDDAEGTSPAARALIGRLSVCAPESRFLVTSRERLGVPGEVAVELGPLGLPPASGAPADEVFAAEAVLLFAARARAAGAAVGPGDASDVAALVHALDGIPLAIELAAGQAGLLAPAEIRARLGAHLALPSGQGMADRHATLRAAIDGSWAMLAPAERLLLLQCAVFAGGFTVDAAEAVLDLRDPSAGTRRGVVSAACRPAHRIVDVLRMLRDRSLVCVQRPPGGERSRLSLHASIREYALERLEASGAATATRRRHARYYLAAGGDWADAMRRSGSDEARAWLRAEQENLSSVMENAIARRTAEGTAEAVAAVLCLEPLLDNQGRASELAAMIDRAFPPGSVVALPDAVAARVALARGVAQRVQGRLEESLRELHRALALAAPLGDASLEGEIRMHLAIRLRQAGDPDAAIACGERARELLRGAANQRLEASNLAALGLTLAEADRPDEARRHDERARQIFRGLGDRWSEGLALGNLAQLDHAAAKAYDARWHYDKAIEAFRHVGDRLSEAVHRGLLATLEHEHGRLDEAREGYRAAIAVFAHRRAVHLEGLVRAHRGALEARAGDLAAARAELDRAEGLLRSVDGPAFLLALEVHRGELDVLASRRAAEVGDDERARELRASAELRLSRGRIDPGQPAGAALQRAQGVRFAARMLARALAERGPEQPSVRVRPARGEPTGARTPGASALGTKDTRVLVAEDAVWFIAADREAVSLLRRGGLRRILLALVEHHAGGARAGLARDEILARGWPDEKVLVEAGSKRVRVAIATLRRLGLERVLLTRDDGYLLDPGWQVERRASEGFEPESTARPPSRRRS